MLCVYVYTISHERLKLVSTFYIDKFQFMSLSYPLPVTCKNCMHVLRSIYFDLFVFLIFFPFLYGMYIHNICYLHVETFLLVCVIFLRFSEFYCVTAVGKELLGWKSIHKDCAIGLLLDGRHCHLIGYLTYLDLMVRLLLLL